MICFKLVQGSLEKGGKAGVLVDACSSCMAAKELGDIETDRWSRGGCESAGGRLNDFCLRILEIWLCTAPLLLLERMSRIASALWCSKKVPMFRVTL